MPGHNGDQLPEPDELPEHLQLRKVAIRDADKSIHYLAFLFEEFHPRCYWFLVLDCLRKLALTGLPISSTKKRVVAPKAGLFDEDEEKEV